jgi:hypothetical protein
MTILAFIVASLVMAVSTPPTTTTTAAAQAFILRATLQHRYHIRTYKHVCSALNMRFAVVSSSSTLYTLKLYAQAHLLSTCCVWCDHLRAFDSTDHSCSNVRDHSHSNARYCHCCCLPCICVKCGGVRNHQFSTIQQHLQSTGNNSSNTINDGFSSFLPQQQQQQQQPQQQQQQQHQQLMHLQRSHGSSNSSNQYLHAAQSQVRRCSTQLCALTKVLYSLLFSGTDWYDHNQVRRSKLQACHSMT